MSAVSGHFFRLDHFIPLLRDTDGHFRVNKRPATAGGHRGGAMLPVCSPGGTPVYDIPPEPRLRVRGRTGQAGRLAASPYCFLGGCVDARGSRRATIGRGLVASCRGTFLDQATGIVTRRDETAKPARASGTRGRARPPEASRPKNYWNGGLQRPAPSRRARSANA
jgi:hypothetical protein